MSNHILLEAPSFCCQYFSPTYKCNVCEYDNIVFIFFDYPKIKTGYKHIKIHNKNTTCSSVYQNLEINTFKGSLKNLYLTFHDTNKYIQYFKNLVHLVYLYKNKYNQ